jgi:hypothetical protein
VVAAGAAVSAGLVVLVDSLDELGLLDVDELLLDSDEPPLRESLMYQPEPLKTIPGA